MSVGDDLDGLTVYTPHQIAQRWGVTAETVRVRIRSGELEGFRVGPRLIRVRADKLAEYEARRAAEAARPMTEEEREAERARDRRRDVLLSGLRVGWARGRTACKARLQKMNMKAK